MALALLAAASVSFTSRSTLEIVDPVGRPQIAYALYMHRGESFSLAHPVSYEATPETVIRSDDAGRLTFPAALHVHRPFPLQTHPALWIRMIYVPRLHNAEGSIAEDRGPSTIRSWEFDAATRRVTAYDLSDRPERWEGTLSNLSFFVRPLVTPPRAGGLDAGTAANVRELIGHFRAEYHAFLERWGGTLRPRPAMPAMFSDDEKRRWAEMVDRDLAERPTWGMEIRRRYEGELASLTEIEADLARR